MTDTPPPQERFATFIRHFADALWSLGADYEGGLLSRATIMLILGRILPIAHRLRAIAERVAQGTLRRPPTRQPGTTPPTPRPPAPRWPHRLRGTHAWLVRLAPITAAFGSQLDALLRAPDMQALIEAAPQLRRLFRPLCRMLGTTTLKDSAPPSPARQPRRAPVPAPLSQPRPTRLSPIPWRAPKLA